jgi:hypothetical protein
MIGLVIAVALAGVLVRVLCYNTRLGIQVNDTSKKLFGG